MTIYLMTQPFQKVTGDILIHFLSQMETSAGDDGLLFSRAKTVTDVLTENVGAR